MRQADPARSTSRRHILWVLLLLLLLLLPSAPLWSPLLSPGALATSHADSGRACFDCHSPFRQVPDFKCVVCHEASVWTSAALAALHDRADLSRCVDCHPEHRGADGPLLIAFTHDDLPVAGRALCAGCHERVEDAVHQDVNAECGVCHETTAWTPASFEHGALSVHGTACDACHGAPPDSVHTTLSARCDACHETSAWAPAGFDHELSSDGPRCRACHRGPSDVLHQDLSARCDSCHETPAWTPSTFEHRSYFRFDRHHPEVCTDCHEEESYSTYTCYGCHRRGEVREEHVEEGIREYDVCVECHRSGDEDEAERKWRSRSGRRRGRHRSDHHDDD